MSDSASLNFEGKEIKLPIITGSENEKAIDISKLRSETGLVTLDKGFKKVPKESILQHISRYINKK